MKKKLTSQKDAVKHLIKSIKPKKLIQRGPMMKMSIFQKLYANCFDLKNIMKCYFILTNA